MEARFYSYPRKRYHTLIVRVACIAFVLFFTLKTQAQPPTITLFSPATVCQGDAVTITGTNFNNVSAVTLGTQAAASFTVNDPTSITAYVAGNAADGNVTVTTPGGTATATGTLTIKPAPKPGLTDIGAGSQDPFTNCSGTATYQLKVSNSSSVSGSSNQYDIDWGDGTAHFTQTDWPGGAQTSHTYTSQGFFTITITITPSNGCTRSMTYKFYNGLNPLASFTTTTSTTGLCTPAAIQFQIGNWFNNSAGTIYQIDFGDGTPVQTLTHPLNGSNTVQLVSHTYNTTSCPASPDFTATLRAINGCFITTYTLNQIIIRKKPTADFTIPNATACINTPVCFTNQTINGFSGNSCISSSTLTWDFGDGTPTQSTTSPCHTYTAPGIYTVTLSASNTACGADSKTRTVTILPTSPPPTLSATPIVYCKGDPASPLTATGSGLLWYTTATGGTGSPNAPTPSTTTPGTYTWYVSQTLGGACESSRLPVTVTVNALPAAPLVTSPVQLCQNQPASPLTATGANLLWYTTPTGGTGSSTAPTPSTATTGTTTWYVSQSANGCEGPRAAIVVNVAAIPLAPTVTSPVNYCQSQSASPLTATGANLLWYTVATGGTGSPTAPTPSTATVGATTYYVSASGACGESPRTAITVNVFAGPSATIGYTPAILCNTTGSSTVSVTQTGSAGGTYSITPTGLTINATTGDLSPSGAAPGTYSVRYTIAAAGGCGNFVTTATVTVTASPSASISYPAICSSDGATTVRLTGTPGGAYSSTPGLSIDPATGTITPAASTVGTYTVTYDIAASPPCPGFSTTAPVTISQAPLAAISYANPVLCNVQNTTSTPNPLVPVTQTGTTGGAYSITPATGLHIDATTGTLDPSGATPGNYTIRYSIPGSGGCATYSVTTSVSVSSTPSAAISYPAICSSDGPVAVQRTGTAGGSYSSTPGLSIDQATGAITPAASTAGTYTVTYTIAASAPCPGFSTTASVTISQAPLAAISYANPVLCNVQNTASTPNPPVPVTQTGTPGGTYSVTPATGLSVNTTNGTIDPSGATPGTYIIRYSIAAGGGCAAYSTTTSVTVSGAPSATISYAALCSSDAPAAVTRTGTPGGSYSSTPGLSINAATGTITPGTSTPGTYTVTYTIAASAPCPGFATAASVTISQAPSASIVYNPTALCNVPNTTATPNPPVPVTQTGTTGGAYSITPAAGLPIDPATGTLIPANAAAGSYIIKYTAPGTGACASYSTTTTVIVSNAPLAAISYAGPYCRATTTAQPVTRTGTAGGIFSSTSGLAIDATTGAINPAASTPGTYTVTYTIAPSSPCPGYTATTTIVIDDSPVLTFAQPVQSICSGGTATFIPSSTVTGTSYTWSLAGTLPTGVSGITSGAASGANPAIVLTFTNTGTVGRTLTIQVVPTNPVQHPCPGAPVNITLTVNPIPAALVTDTAHFCMGDAPQPLSATPAAGNTLRWYDQNHALLSAAPVVSTTVPRQFNYFVSQYSGAGCESPQTPFIAIVHPKAQITGSSYTSPTACGLPTGKIVLKVLDIAGNPIPRLILFVHYNKFATPYTILDSTDVSGNITIPLTAGTYTGFYVDIHGCASQVIPDVFVLQDPTPPAPPVAGYNPPLCSETELRLTALSPTSTVAGPISYVWAGPAFGSSPDTTRNTVISFPSAPVTDAGTYVVYAIQNNCISLPVSFPVAISPSPLKPVITTRNPLCVGDDLLLQAASSISAPNASLVYTWKGPAAGFPANGPNASVRGVHVSDAGIYTITVTSPQTGCSSSTDTLIQIGDYPVVRFARDTFTLPTGYILPMDPVIVNAAAPGVLPIKNYQWTPSGDITCNDPACSLPVALVKNNVCYSVKATNIYGCSGSDTLCIKVFCESSQIFIPNAFTPGGNIPGNTRFTIRASGIGTIKSFRVFNRWGRIVFERANFVPNDPAFGWDGRIDGKPADPGVYIYTVDVLCENGVPYTYKGNVTLL